MNIVKLYEYKYKLNTIIDDESIDETPDQLEHTDVELKDDRSTENERQECILASNREIGIL